MRRNAPPGLLAAVVLIGAATPGPVRAGDDGSTPPVQQALGLAVPFVAQPEALCGGAVVSMVTHYWGDRDVHAADFAPLIDERAHGIRVADLIDAMERRGWSAQAFAADRALVAAHLERRRPMIALVEDRPGRMHYVVIVAWDDDGVVVHDPARGPNRLVDSARFEEAWGASGFLTLLVLPRAAPVEPSSTEPVEVSPQCRDHLAEAVGFARQGALERAEDVLERAIASCPNEAAPVRELAGLRLRQDRWLDASRLAERAALLDETDRHAWRMLAVSRFLAGDAGRALDAWNAVDEPRLDLLDIRGLSRTHASVIADLIDLSPRDVLIEKQLRHARRRLAALPTVTAARLAYRPQASGHADLEVHVPERPLVVHSPATAMVTVGRAVIERHARVTVSSPTGGGEAWSGDWRWQANRPRVGLTLVVPRSSGAGTLWRVDALWERNSFGVHPSGTAAGLETETRQRLSLHVGDWVTPDVRWSAGAGLEQWNGQGRHLALDLELEARAADDRAVLYAAASLWVPVAAESGFMTTGITAAWRSPTRVGARVTAQVGLHGVTGAAPLSLWPRPDTGQAGTTLLRAHPALKDGIVLGERLGRALLGGTVEVERRMGRIGPVGAGLAVFADVARVWRRSLRPLGNEPRFQADVGVGLRFDLPGEDQRLGLSLGHGLRDGGTVASIGWISAVP